MRVAFRGLLLLGISAIAYGQAGGGTITGTISDQAGAVVVGANVEATNSQTGASYLAQSTTTGNYTISQLPVGTYALAVKIQGFKAYTHSDLAVQAAAIVREDVTLQVGNASDTVTVSAQASLLNTETGDLTHNITVDNLDSLPILGIGGTNAGSSGIRNPYNLATLLPGVDYQANTTMIVNGAPTNSEAVRIEGMDMTNHFVNFALQEMQPSADSIQEVAVQTSNYAAEFGTAGGGLFNITMKSGTNKYHGSAYDYFVNEDLNAAYPFTQDVNGHKYRPRNRRNDYGGTLGGPIDIPKLYNGRNRSFFFFNWEEFLESSNITFNTTLPAAAFRQGDFSAISPNGGANFNPNIGVPAGVLPAKDNLGNPIFANEIYDPLTRNPTAGTASPFPGNIIPLSRIDPVSAKVLALLPRLTNNNLINNGSGTNLSQRTTIIPSLKLDHSIGTKSKISFFWSETNTDSQFSTPNGNADGLPAEITAARGTFFHYHVFRLNYDYTLTPTLLLHFGAGYNQINAFDDAPYLTFNAQQQLGLAGFEQNRNFPDFNGASSFSLGGLQNIGTAGQIQSHTFQEKPSFNSNATWVRGSHTLKVGGEVYFQGTVTQPFAGVLFNTGTGPTSLPLTGLNLAGQSMGFGFASFLLGDYSSIQQNAPADYRLGKSQWAVFLQDSWKVNRKLTLDYGLRWDYGTYAQDTFGRVAALGNVPNPSAGGRLGGAIYGGTCNCAFANNYPYAIGPRLGFAYQLAPKTVLRGGWGVVYSFVPDLNITPPLAAINQPGGINPLVNIETTGAIPQPTFPTFNAGIYPTVPGSTNSAPTAVDRNAGRPPRQNQWSIGVEREISQNLVLEASYVGNRGMWWTGAGPDLGLLEQISPATFQSYGLTPYTNVADNALLSQLVTSPSAVSRFGHVLQPYSSFNGTVLQALEAFPQFSTAGFLGNTYTTANAPTGDTWYNALQAKATKRLSHGLQATGTFTWSKSLVSTREDFWNPGSSSKTFQSTDQPFLLNANITYTTPKATFLDHLVKGAWENKVHLLTEDWQLGTFLQYGSGFPLTPPSATTVNNLTLANGGTNYQVPTGQPFFLKDLNCHCINPYTDQVLNPAAWTNPGTGTWGGNALYGNFRSERRPSENLNFGRNFKIRENMNLQVRAEFVNIFNRTYLGNPSTVNPGAPPIKNAQGQYTAGFGAINATAAVGTATTNPGIPSGLSTTQLPRTGTLIARFSF
jgi:hypothetical protein